MKPALFLTPSLENYLFHCRNEHEQLGRIVNAYYHHMWDDENWKKFIHSPTTQKTMAKQIRKVFILYTLNIQ